MIYLSAIQMWKPYVGENCPLRFSMNILFCMMLCARAATDRKKNDPATEWETENLSDAKIICMCVWKINYFDMFWGPRRE